MKDVFISQEFGDLTISYTGKEKCISMHSFSWELPGEFLIHYILEGKGVVKYDNTEYHLESGNAFLISDKRGFYYADEKEPWTYIWVRFSGEIAKRFIKTIGLSIQNPIYKTINPDRIASRFEEIINLRMQNNEFLIYGKFLTLLGEMIQFSANEIYLRKNIIDNYINMCCDFVSINYHIKITAKDLAKIAGIEYSYLFRLFKANLGTSPGEYIINYKLSKAAALLTDGDLPVSEVAYSVGYEDRIAFSKLFKKRYGVSPLNYRQNN